MRRNNLVCLVIAAALVMLSTAASAWNDTGHRVVALMAYQTLDGNTQAKVIAILKQHPHYDSYLAKDIPASANKDEWIVMQAATWPDWVRSGSNRTRYHHGTWHYINKPIVKADDEDTRDDLEDRFNAGGQNHGDILKIIPECKQMISAPADTTRAKKNRAIRLCWLFHLAGDLHQPLHAVALCTEQLPDGDRGGNFTYVTSSQNQSPTKLHTYWDHSLGNQRGFDDIKGIVADLKHNVPVSNDERNVVDPKAWADEGVQLAKTHVYFFGGNWIEFVIDDDSHPPSHAPFLPNGYDTAARNVARKQASLAAYRLADALTATLANVH